MASKSTLLICLACYKDRLASVCENANEYRLFEIRENNIYPAGLLSLPSKDPMDRTSAILACGVSSFLCGALCRRHQLTLEKSGLDVHAWLTGSADQVVAAFRDNTLEAYTMPGYTTPTHAPQSTGDRAEASGTSSRQGRKLRLFTPPGSAI